MTRLILLLLSLTAFSLQAAPRLVPSPPKLAATGYLLVDYHSGRVIAESNADERLEPASLTKMMTAYVVMQELASGRIQMEDEVTISRKARYAIGSRMFVEQGSRVRVEALLKGLAIQSGTDASIALAEYVAGAEEGFVALMNQYAELLGMDATHFANATGLPHDDHYTSARDMARLASALLRDFPEHYSLYSEKEYTYNDIRQPNRNRLLWRDKRVDGIKTGHTEAAGFCLVASALQDEMRLISVVMGTRSEEARAVESQKLLNYGFRFYETHRLYAAAQPLKSMRIWKGEHEQLQLGLAEDLYVTVPRGQYQELKASLTVEQAVMAPARRGQRFGSVNVRLGGESVAEMPLVALQDVAEGGLFQKLSDSVLLLFE